MTDTKPQIQKAQGTSKGVNATKIQQHKTVLRHIVFKLQIIRDQKNVVRSQEGKNTFPIEEQR